MFTSYAGKLRGRDLLQARSEQLDLADANSGAEKWLDQPGALDDVQRRRLQRGAARFVMRRQPALHHARPDAMAKKLARREQSGRTAPDDQNGRTRFDLAN
jgi:hypothetical protein